MTSRVHTFKYPRRRKNNVIIDSHTHVWGSEHLPPEWIKDLRSKGFHRYDRIEFEQLIEDMNEAGVDKAVVLAHELQHKWSHPQPMNKYILDGIRKYPDRLIGFAGAAPLDRYGRFNRKSFENFEEFVVKFGFKGMKLLPIYDHYKPNDRQVYPFYEKAVQLKIPVLLHQSATLTTNTPMEYGRPIHLDDPVQDFPELKFIVAHLGYPWAEELLVLMRKLPNLYADISASVLYRPSILAWNIAMAKEYKVLDRILFGTDYPVTKQKQYVDWLRNSYNPIAEKNAYPTLNQQEIDGILGGNAAQLLGLI